MATTLLYRPCFKAGMGPKAFLHHVAFVNRISVRALYNNGFRFGGAILRDWGCAPLKYAEPATDAFVDRVSRLRDTLPEAWISGRWRLCPMCWLKGSVPPAGWEVRFADACTIHCTWLIDVCDGCGSRLTYSMLQRGHCRCGHFLSSQPSRACPREVVALTRIFTELLTTGRSTALPPPLGKLGFEDLQRVVRLFGAYGLRQVPQRAQKTLECQSLVQSWQVSSLAATVLDGWPTRFHELLAKLYRSGGESEDRRLKDTFSGFYAELFRAYSGPQFDAIRSEFQKFLSANWRGALARRNRRLSRENITRSAWISFAEARRLLGLSSLALARNLRQARVHVETHRTPTGRSFQYVRREDVLHLVNAPPPTGSDARLKTLLGVSKARARRLGVGCAVGDVQLGLWPNEQSPSFKTIALLDAVLGDAVAVSCVSGNMVTFAHVLKYWAWSDESIVGLIHAIAHGRLEVRGRQTGVRGVTALIFDEKAIRDWHKTSARRWASGIRVPEVAERLGVKQEVAYYLVRRGFVLSEKATNGTKRLAAMVSEMELERFSNCYVFGRSLAYSIKTSPKALGLELAARGIQAVGGPGVDEGRQLIFQRSRELEQAVASISSGGFLGRGLNGEGRSIIDSM